MGYSDEDRDSIKAGGLTRLEKLFAESYVIDFVGTQAILRVDGDTLFPGNRASMMLKSERVRRYIDVLLEKRMKNMRVDAEWVLNAAVELYEKCMVNVEVKDSDGIPIGVYKFDSRGANAALNTIGKHVGVQAFKKLVEHTGKEGGPIVFWGGQGAELPKKRKLPFPSPSKRRL